MVAPNNSHIIDAVSTEILRARETQTLGNFHKEFYGARSVAGACEDLDDGEDESGTKPLEVEQLFIVITIWGAALAISVFVCAYETMIEHHFVRRFLPRTH